MRIKHFLLIFSFIILLASNNSRAETVNHGLDSNAVHALYVDGDFEKATVVLEQAIQEKKLTTHADSVFAYKHLGVMYAALPETREKGKYYMLQLIILEPTVRIMDMYASDMIYMIFKNTRDEYEMSRLRLKRAEGHVNGNQLKPSPAQPDSTVVASTQTPHNSQPAQPPATKPSTKSRVYYWVGGTGVAMVGIGIATFFLLKENPTTTRLTYNVE